SNVGYCITNPTNPNEFYLFESRNRKGTDAYIPADGMLVWHVDYDADIWYQNIVNDSRNHQYVDLIEADGKASKTNRNAGDCFPGSNNVTTLSTSWWDKSSTGIVINDIARKGTEITFNISKKGGNQGNGETNPPSVTDIDYTVADVINSTENDYDVTISGYIVGWVYGSNFLTGARFSVNDDNVSNTNLMLADTADETDPTFCIPVQLPSGAVRSGLNLKDNPSILGRRVMLTGNVERYFATRGFKSVSSYEFLPDAPSSIDDVTTDATDAAEEWFTIQGHRVATPTAPGFYISTSGRKLLLR
ncbi:MAG: hypothetical protein K2M97_05965, partial [Muribaculaceae bacterium]|nr:hypothetical protein [Muribaculaceae bacterium]